MNKYTNYKVIKKQLINCKSLSYRSYIKALLSLELKIDDENILEILYTKFLFSPYSTLINEDFIDFSEEIREKLERGESKFYYLNVFASSQEIKELVRNELGEFYDIEFYKKHVYKEREYYSLLLTVRANLELETETYEIMEYKELKEKLLKHFYLVNYEEINKKLEILKNRKEKEIKGVENEIYR